MDLRAEGWVRVTAQAGMGSTMAPFGIPRATSATIPLSGRCQPLPCVATIRILCVGGQSRKRRRSWAEKKMNGETAAAPPSVQASRASHSFLIRLAVSAQSALTRPWRSCYDSVVRFEDLTCIPCGDSRASIMYSDQHLPTKPRKTQGGFNLQPSSRETVLHCVANQVGYRLLESLAVGSYPRQVPCKVGFRRESSIFDQDMQIVQCIFRDLRDIQHLEVIAPLERFMADICIARSTIVWTRSPLR